MTQIEAIKDSARKSKEAFRLGDFSLSTSLRNWARKAIRLENNPKEAEKEYNKAYGD